MLQSFNYTNLLNLFLYSAKLRARQKERIVQRHSTEVLYSTNKTELLREPQIPSVKEAQSLDASKHLDDAGEDVSAVNMEETKLSQPFESKRNSSTAKVGRFSKHGYRRYHSTHLDLSVKPSGNFSPDIFLPSHHLLSGASANPVPSAHLLPVLGLCAPNASQMLVTRKSQSIPAQPLSDHEQRKANTRMSEIPFPVPACSGPSNDLNNGEREPAGDPSLFLNISGEASQCHMKDIVPDNFFPFVPVCFTLFPSYFHIRPAYLP